MKKLKLLITVCLFTFIISVNSQTVNDIPIEDIDVTYIQIVGTSRLFSKKVTIKIDFGQHEKFISSGNETQIKDENGKIMKFNSMIDALNFMNSKNYKFIQAYAFSVGNQNVYHYLMKKNKN